VHEELDRMQGALDAAIQVIHDVARSLNQAAHVQDHVRVTEGTNDAGLILTVTKHRWKFMVDQVPAGYHHDGGSTLSHPDIGPAYNDAIHELRRQLSDACVTKYRAYMLAFTQNHLQGLQLVVETAKQLDVVCAVARIARERGYTRPECPLGVNTSWVRIQGLRHPIIEVVNDTAPYVTNDVALGCDEVRGMLLYGVNAVGKSSVMKAAGLAVLMAQAGMFVPAAHLELCPFTQLLTRIGMHDDLYSGHSTFMVEMLELRSILMRADARSLVIGDELCAGTESVSALAIVGSGIVQLARRGAAFMFATHLHELTKLRCIKEVVGLRVCHLHVDRDPDTGCLVLHRRIMPGQGMRTYGIEVCETLDMGTEFMECSHAIRREVMDVPPHLVRRQPTKYNRNVYVDQCVRCGGRAEEVHHIVPQAQADDATGLTTYGSFAPFHKNQRFNLAPLCSKCHDAVHAEMSVENIN
jgi:DNA mismatch repair protein MutS